MVLKKWNRETEGKQNRHTKKQIGNRNNQREILQFEICFGIILVCLGIHGKAKQF